MKQIEDDLLLLEPAQPARGGNMLVTHRRDERGRWRVVILDGVTREALVTMSPSAVGNLLARLREAASAARHEERMERERRAAEPRLGPPR